MPLPWTRADPYGDGFSYGFGAGTAHLPQPAWFGDLAVDVQDGDPGSTLDLYRRAVALRRRLQGAETLTWLEAEPEVLVFQRPGGWRSFTNFGTHPVPLPPGEVLLASSAVVGRTCPGSTTVWLRAIDD